MGLNQFMLRNIKQLYGRKLGATDGRIGLIKDLYFDDVAWTVRYLVADTGSWLSGRKVLLSRNAFAAYALAKSDFATDVLPVEITREQIERSPSLDSRSAITRQHEENYFGYFGWEGYWNESPASWSETNPSGASSDAEKVPTAAPVVRSAQLRSTREISEYYIHATDGRVGSIKSILFDGDDWTIRELLIETGSWYAGRSLCLRPGNISRVLGEESTIFVNMTKEALATLVSEQIAQAEEVQR